MKDSKKYPLLNDKDWLICQYIDNNLSTVDISNLIGCNHGQVYTRLQRYNIPIRSRSEGHRVKRDDSQYQFIFNQEVIEGSLLGDAHFKRIENREDSYPSFVKNNINYDHILFVAKHLFVHNWELRISEIENKGNYNGKNQFKVATWSEIELKPLYQRWYPEWNNYKKVIPYDINVTPTVLLHWFMDDGSSFHRRKNSPTKQIYIEFYCQSFNREELSNLCDIINHKFDLKAAPHLHQRHGIIKGTGMEVIIPQSKSRDFYDIIGPCPVPSFQYKWK
jgi:hypothetical protein